MKNERLIAYVLIAVGAVALLSSFGDADWLWIALVSAALLAGYISRENYGFLVAGSVCAGVAVGTMIGTYSGMLISLGAGFLAVDRVEPRPNRWPLYLAGALAGVGLLVGINNVLNSFWIALIFIGGGAYLLWRDNKDSDVVSTTPSTSSTSSRSAPKTEPVSTATGTSQTQSGQANPATSTPTSTSQGVDMQKTPASSEPAVQTFEQTGENSASSPKEVATQRTQGPEEGASEALNEPELNADAQERYRLLETWRRETARAEGNTAYFVLRNETLRLIAQENPKTLDELEQIKGIGPVKLERYGDAVLGVLRGEQPASQA